MLDRGQSWAAGQPKEWVRHNLGSEPSLVVAVEVPEEAVAGEVAAVEEHIGPEGKVLVSGVPVPCWAGPGKASSAAPVWGWAAEQSAERGRHERAPAQLRRTGWGVERAG